MQQKLHEHAAQHIYNRSLGGTHDRMLDADESGGLFRSTFNKTIKRKNIKRFRWTRSPRQMLVDDVAGRADHLFQVRAAPYLG